MAIPREPLHVAVAIDGYGLHPGVGPSQVPSDALVDGSLALRHALRAEAAGIDIVTLDDRFDDGPGADALLVMAKLGPLTSNIGLIPTITTTHTEPFHVAKNVATLDWVSQGRGGWRVAVSDTDAEAGLFGRKSPEPAAELHAEAADAVEVVRRLWDSWEDDAIIRDVGTGRFIDRDKVHYIDFESSRFRVRGPSIVPRSPQGQPLVMVDAVDASSTTLAVAAADLIVIDADDVDEARARRADLRRRVAEAGRDPEEIDVFVRIEFVLGDTVDESAARSAALDAVRAWTTTASRLRFVGTSAGLAELITTWSSSADGVLLHPASHQLDLAALCDDVLPALQARGFVRAAVRGRTLRDHLRLPRPDSRYAAARASSESRP